MLYSARVVPCRVGAGGRCVRRRCGRSSEIVQRGQSAHARGDLEKAIGFYEQALKVRPEFPEAEFQRGSAFASLGRLAEADAALRLAISYKKNWSLPYSALGVVLMRQSRDKDAEQFFRQALNIDNKDSVALRVLSELRLRAGDPKEALDLAKRATANTEAPASAWIGLAMAERANGNTAAAKAALDHVLADEPENIAALLERADLFKDEKNLELAITDLRAAAKLKPQDKVVNSRLAEALQQAGKADEALAVAKSAGLEIQQAAGNGAAGVVGTPEEIEAANSADPAIARKALEKLLEKNPHNAMLLGRLGASYRTDDPARSLEFYRKASEFNPTIRNMRWVTGPRWSRRVDSSGRVHSAPGCKAESRQLRCAREFRDGTVRVETLCRKRFRI